MKQLMVAGNKGYVVLGGVNDKGEVWTKKLSAFYEEGNKNHTVPNVMASLARVIHNYVPVGEQARIWTIGAVASKINSDILVKEAMFGYTVGKTRTKLSPQELGMYRTLVKVIKQRYGDILIADTQYVAKTVKAGMFADDYNAHMIYNAVKKVLDELVGAVVADDTNNVADMGFDLGMDDSEPVVATKPSASTETSVEDMQVAGMADDDLPF